MACGTLIDDMEDGSGRICQGAGRVGVWYAFNDGNVTQQPAPTTPGIPIAPALIPGGRDGSTQAMHTWSEAFDHETSSYGWGAGIGFDLAFDGVTYGLYDASAYSGIRFWARSDISTNINVRISTECTTAPEYGGTCIWEGTEHTGPGDTCNPAFVSVPLTTEWAEYSVSFVEASTIEHVREATGCGLQSERVTNVQFLGSDGGADPFDFWIDDVSFVPNPDPNCCPNPKVGCEGELSFGEPLLADLVKSQTGTATGKLLCSDACRLHTLTIDQPEIRSLAGMECLEGLESLSLQDSEVTDLTPLAGLIGLNSLTVHSPTLSDLHPLANLTNLTSLSLGGRSITDLTPLISLTKLTQLDIDYTPLSNLNALAGLVNLETLRLPYNSVSDLTPLTNLTALSLIQLDNNQITDISALAANTGLGTGDTIHMTDNPMDCESQSANVQALRDRGVTYEDGCPRQ